MVEVKGRRKWEILAVVITFTFMATLDSSIINVALPKMAQKLNVATSQIQFVSTAYLIAIVGTILLFGRLGDMFGKVKMFKTGLLIFTLGSLLCGIEVNFTFLIISRIIQGIGASMVMANNQGIIAEVFPVNERGRALGFTGTAVALGTLVGPGLGGLIVGLSSWEYIFLINVPVGLVALFYSYRLLPKEDVKNEEKIDGFGAILFAFTVITLFTTLNASLTRGFNDLLIIFGIIGSIVLFSVFIYVEKIKIHPLLQLGIFKNKLFSLSLFTGYLTFIVIFIHNIVFPFYLQNVLDFSPQYAGLILMLYPLILGVIAPLSGHLSDQIGSELLAFIGLVLVSIGTLLFTTLNADSHVGSILVFISIMSLGGGLFQSPNNSLVMSSVERNQLGVAGSINALVRNVGMISGIVVGTSLLYGMMSYKLGFHVTSLGSGTNDAFLFGMKIAYLVAGLISLLGAVLTFYRLKRKK